MRENKRLEYKENMESGTFLKTISAYANYGGGKIIFGIADDGTVKGISKPEEACLNLENKINDSIKPVPEYSIEIGEDSTIILSVCEGPYKPYLYKGKAYKRYDSATIEVDRLEYGRLILEGQNQSYEELPSSMQELTFDRLEEELKESLGITSLNEDILKTLELYSEKRGFNNAAALLADRNQFPGIDMIRFGSSIDEIMDRATFEHMSVLAQLSSCIEMFQTYYQYEKIEGVERKQIDKIPEKAFREAIANALVHRAWDVRASIKISMFEDRIEISSPGGLPAGIGREEYLNGQISVLRNPILGNVFFRLKYIEKFGTGIMRINRSYSNALEKPSYQIFENSIQVVLPVIASDEKLSEKDKKILDIIRDKGTVSRSEIEKLAGTGKDSTIRSLNLLLKKHIIEKTGAGRGVKYHIR
ncbi:AAA family ATPase [Drancourtella sp. An12]|uniref:ATP-binding protein n=1 Tax=Drancourtella sp. An12 TaxID=1965548 RepID=UPI000B382E94|nr:ATP-binding protein [Drancourtella sp. An12]OUQ47052.1 AAA family ATPase [Drancourtella sp. An12]